MEAHYHLLLGGLVEDRGLLGGLEVDRLDAQVEVHAFLGEVLVLVDLDLAEGLVLEVLVLEVLVPVVLVPVVLVLAVLFLVVLSEPCFFCVPWPLL